MTNREIDELTAEKVMGWEWLTPEQLAKFHVQGPRIQDPKYPGRLCPAPNYSIDIAAAMQAIERMWELGWDGNVEWYKANGLTRIYRAAFRRIDKQETCAIAFALTAPMAIVLAALKAVGVEVTEARG